MYLTLFIFLDADTSYYMTYYRHYQQSRRSVNDYINFVKHVREKYAMALEFLFRHDIIKKKSLDTALPTQNRSNLPFGTTPGSQIL